MRKLILFILGGILWLCVHRFGQLYMGEATLLLLVTGVTGLELRQLWEVYLDNHPNDRTRVYWDAWDIICWISGGILLDGLVRWM